LPDGLNYAEDPLVQNAAFMFSAAFENSLTQEKRTLLQGMLDEAVAEGRIRMQTMINQNFAELLAYLGEWDECMDAIERAIDCDLSDLVWLGSCPLFQPLFEMPRYTELYKRLEDRIRSFRY